MHAVNTLEHGAFSAWIQKFKKPHGAENGFPTLREEVDYHGNRYV